MKGNLGRSPAGEKRVRVTAKRAEKIEGKGRREALQIRERATIDKKGFWLEEKDM